jgi:hypothetical protein
MAYYLTLRTTHHFYAWTGKTWAPHPSTTKFWKTRRGAQAQIDRLRAGGWLAPGERPEIVES